MSDLEFDVRPRNTAPITFRLGGNTLLEPAREANPETGEGAREAIYGPAEHEYVFTPPKNAIMLMPLMGGSDAQVAGLGLTKATYDWLGEGLSKEDNERIIARLRDPKDDLDAPDLEKVVEALADRVVKRPTS